MSKPELPILSKLPIRIKDDVPATPIRRRSAPSAMPTGLMLSAPQRIKANETLLGLHEALVPPIISNHGTEPQTNPAQSGPDMVTAAHNLTEPDAFFHALAAHLDATHAPKLHFPSCKEAADFLVGQGRRWDSASVTTFNGRPYTSDHARLYVRRLILAMRSQNGTLDSLALSQRYASFLQKEESHKAIEAAAWRVVQEMILYHFVRGGPASVPVTSESQNFKGSWSLHFDTLCQLFEKHKTQVIACMGNAVNPLALTVAEPSFRIQRILDNARNNNNRKEKITAIKRKAEARSAGSEQAGPDLEERPDDQNMARETRPQQHNHQVGAHMDKKVRLDHRQGNIGRGQYAVQTPDEFNANHHTLQPVVAQLNGREYGDGFLRAGFQPAFAHVPAQTQRPLYIQTFGQASTAINGPAPQLPPQSVQRDPRASPLETYAPLRPQHAHNHVITNGIGTTMPGNGQGIDFKPIAGNQTGHEPVIGNLNTQRSNGGGQ